MFCFFLLGVKKSENHKTSKIEQKKSKPAITRPSEKFIDDDKDKEEMKIAGKIGKKKNKGKNKKKQEKKHKKKTSQTKNTVTSSGRPKELIPEDIKILRKHEKISADSLPGGYGEDPTIGMEI